MAFAFALLMFLHGAIHWMGFAKGFGMGSRLPLKQPISRAWGVVWLTAALLWFTSSVLVVASSSLWWLPACVALLASQAAIVKSFADAKWGSVVNLIVLVPLAVTLLDYRESSLSSLYAREHSLASTQTTDAPVTEADIAHLPALVQAYLRATSAVGRPRVHAFRARMRGELRSAVDAPWMHVDIDQVNAYEPSSRIFFARGKRWGVPFEALHRFVGDSATMRVRIASLLEVVDASGREMNQSETVTVFNDMCLFAPATLIDPSIEWQVLDASSVRARFRRGSIEVHARLHFNQRGELVDFDSDDRFQSADGKRYVRYRWSTPVQGYGEIRGHHLATRARAQWRMNGSEFEYARFELVDVEYNPEWR